MCSEQRLLDRCCKKINSLLWCCRLLKQKGCDQKERSSTISTSDEAVSQAGKRMCCGVRERSAVSPMICRLRQFWADVSSGTMLTNH